QGLVRTFPRYVIMKLSENYPYKGVYEKCLV
ncbi:hypothetical protein NY836_17365, partial [Escherichia coli]